jgi:hypothetical protein
MSSGFADVPTSQPKPACHGLNPIIQQGARVQHWKFCLLAQLPESSFDSCF